MVGTPHFHCRGFCVQSQVGELRSYMLHSAAKKIFFNGKKKKGFWDFPGGWIPDWGAEILHVKKKKTSVIGLGLIRLKYDHTLTEDICSGPVSRQGHVPRFPTLGCRRVFQTVGPQSCPALLDTTQWTVPPGSSVHGILQARVLEWAPSPLPGNLPDPVNPGLLHCRWILYNMSHQGSLYIWGTGDTIQFIAALHQVGPLALGEVPVS